MRCIAIDVGFGTQDILLYDDRREIAQSFKMVLPSQTTITAARIRRATDLRRSIFLEGVTMGGGPCVRAIKDHLREGLSVYSTETAAKTIYDDLDRVRGLGVKIVPYEAEHGTFGYSAGHNVGHDAGSDEGSCAVYDAIRIETRDIDPSAIAGMLESFGIAMPQVFAVAVQDHGESTGSNRIFRFEHIRKMIQKGGDLRLFSYTRKTIPEYLTRMHAVSETLADYDLVMMDTGPAAVFGAVADKREEPAIVLNIGNGHTLCAILIESRITGVFEHHTRQMNPETLDTYIEKLADGTLTFEEIFESGGHGCYIKEVPDKMPQIIVTGPNRHIAERSRHDTTFAAPYGDMMLTGCFGLVRGMLATDGDRMSDGDGTTEGDTRG